MGFTLSPIIKPQFVGSVAAALTLVTTTSGTTGTAVLARTQLSLWTCRFANVTSSPTTIQVWRVPSGATNDAAHMVINTITIPPATFTQPFFEWSPRYQMAAGDAIWALAGTASAITVTGDGGISI